MHKKICILITLITALTLATPAMAQDGHSDPYWQASYWNNTSLSGTPVLQRQETALDHDWSTGSPGSGVTSDTFSARWTRYIDTAAGTYRFTATSDDGIRVWVDSALIIDQWHDHATTTYTGERHVVTDPLGIEAGAVMDHEFFPLLTPLYDANASPSTA